MKSNKQKTTLLVIDDDKILCNTISDNFKNDMIDVMLAHRGADGVKICSEKRIDIIFLDQKLPDSQGYMLCPSILKLNDQTKIIFSTAYPTFDNALKAIKAGAFDYLSKPFELEELNIIVNKALRLIELEKVEQLQKYKHRKDYENFQLIGNSDAFLETKKLLTLAASTEAPVLITGETGTGKNMAAKFIHHTANQNSDIFISVNCAAIPENLIESELFGHEKGAFTGATGPKKGVFEMANGGTLFLDEIGEIPFQMQAKLLGVLDEKTVKRLGSESTKPINVRIIAATNTDLSQAIKEKKFREDLYYRLSVLRIHIPPLRARIEDIPDLCGFLINKMRSRTEIKISAEELLKLKSYDWPGNVRELRNVLDRAVILRQGNNIKPCEFLESAHQKATEKIIDINLGNKIYTLQEIETHHIKCTLNQLDGNFSITARALGISLSTLKRKLKFI